jgi:hypothetical protein
MSSISDKVGDFIKQYEELEKLNVEAHKNLSEIDLELSNWYHRVEGSVLSHVSKSHKLMKEGKVILEKRRILKLETQIIRSTCDLLKDKIGMLKGTYRKALTKHVELQQEIIDRSNEIYIKK